MLLLVTRATFFSRATGVLSAVQATVPKTVPVANAARPTPVGTRVTFGKRILSQQRKCHQDQKQRKENDLCFSQRLILQKLARNKSREKVEALVGILAGSQESRRPCSSSSQNWHISTGTSSRQVIESRRSASGSKYCKIFRHTAKAAYGPYRGAAPAVERPSSLQCYSKIGCFATAGASRRPRTALAKDLLPLPKVAWPYWPPVAVESCFRNGGAGSGPT